jgi:catechol 2,3-dioxygenase-like lactoylglutathione lyase family enzyme
MITKLSHATLYVLDQEKAYDFYVNKLGFEVRTDAKMGDNFRWLTVGPKGQPNLEIVLYEVKHAGMMDEGTVNQLQAVLKEGKMGGGVFEADDCQKTYEELTKKGVTFIQEPKQQPYGVEAIFTDGCGNWFSLTQH